LRKLDDYFSGTSADARRVLGDIVSAPAFVQENSITHNDIKPGNILFSAARGAVLIDFGLSNMTPIHLQQQWRWRGRLGTSHTNSYRLLKLAAARRRTSGLSV
jgi:serine/threonine protein kinase